MVAFVFREESDRLDEKCESLFCDTSESETVTTSTVPVRPLVEPSSLVAVRLPLGMSTAARRRLMRDFKRLQEDPPAGVSGAPGENNIMVWNAVIFGPDETPFADGTFKLMVSHSLVSFFNVSSDHRGQGGAKKRSKRNA